METAARNASSALAAICAEGGRIEAIYQPYIDGIKEISEINAEYTAPFVK